MPLYACSKCDGYDNTAVTNYWQHCREARAAKVEPAPLCSACDPEIGAWHGMFPQRTRFEAALTMTCSEGYLWTLEQFRPRFSMRTEG